MKNITVEKMEKYYSLLEELLQNKQLDIITIEELSRKLNIPVSEVKDDICCICNSDTVDETIRVKKLINNLQNILCSFRYTHNCLKYFLPKNSCFVYA